MWLHTACVATFVTACCSFVTAQLAVHSSQLSLLFVHHSSACCSFVTAQLAVHSSSSACCLFITAQPAVHSSRLSPLFIRHSPACCSFVFYMREKCRPDSALCFICGGNSRHDSTLCFICGTAVQQQGARLSSNRGRGCPATGGTAAWKRAWKLMTFGERKCKSFVLQWYNDGNYKININQNQYKQRKQRQTQQQVSWQVCVESG